MLKYIKILLLTIVMCLSSIFLYACSSGAVSYLIKAEPQKIVYMLNEEFDPNGISIESYNSDGTFTNVKLGKENFSEVDTSASGEKIVTVTKGNISTSFSVYVPHHIVTTSSNLKEVIKNAGEKEIIFIKGGEYNSSDSGLEYKDIVIDKSLTIIGEKRDETIIAGNFLVGATLSGGEPQAIDLKDVKIMNITFKLENEIKDNKINYNSAYSSFEDFSAIETFDTENIIIKNCSFEGYPYGVRGNNIKGASIVNCSFRHIFLNAFKSNNDIQNTTITRCQFMDIASNVLMEDNGQGYVGALCLTFNEKGNKGVIVSGNVFTRIGLKTGDFVFLNENASTLIDGKNVLFNLSYLTNSSIVLFKSAGEDNLDVGGVILTSNNYGTTNANILFGTEQNDRVNQNLIIISDN